VVQQHICLVLLAHAMPRPPCPRLRTLVRAEGRGDRELCKTHCLNGDEGADGGEGARAAGVGGMMPGNWSRHFARVIAETVKRIKNKDSNAAVLRISYGLRP